MLPLHRGSPPADCGPLQPGKTKTHDGNGSAADVAHPLSVADRPAAGAPLTTDGPQKTTRVAADLCRDDCPGDLDCPKNDAAVVPRSAKRRDDHHVPVLLVLLVLLVRRDARHPLPSPCDRGVRFLGLNAAAPRDLPGDHRGGDRRSGVQSEVSWATEVWADGGLGSDPSDSSESRS